MKIGIDARFLTHPQPGGFKTYTENLIGALSRLDRENQYVLYLDRDPGMQNKVPVQSNFESRVVSGSLPFLGLPWREQVGLRRQVAKDQLDLFHSPCLTAPLSLGCPLVITVHDMIWAFPQKYSRNGSRSIKRRIMEWYSFWIPKYAIGSASAIITVSEAASKSIVEHLNFPSDRIHVTWEAAQPSFNRVHDDQCLDAIRGKYALGPGFILAIGSADPRKNMTALVTAYSLLPDDLRDEYHLAIVWTHSHLAGEVSRQVEMLGLGSRVRFLQQVSDEDLALLYNAASLFVFPSHYEGFGLPLLEAMACGVPVIAADNSSIPEIAGKAALFFNSENVREMSDRMVQVLKDKTVWKLLQQAGFERSAQFSWDRCGHQTLAVYKGVLGETLAQ